MILDKFYARLSSRLNVEVLCVCIPKSGTHLLERALCRYSPLYRRPIRTLHRGNIERYGGIIQILRNLLPKRLLFCHLEYDRAYIDAARAAGVKILFLIRDPRDVCVSEVNPNYSRRPHDLSEASGIGRVDGGFWRRFFGTGLEVDVRGSSGGTGRVDQGPWAAMQPAIATSALR